MATVTEGFCYFGSDGAYNLSAQQNVANTANQMNVANSGTISYGGLLGGLNYYQGQQGLGTQTVTAYYSPQPSMLQDYVEKAMKPAKKAAKGILSKLRAEIEDWHGDVLDRCAA